MSNCQICGQSRRGFILNNKAVCLRCDELLFDLEIELEEVEVKNAEPKPAPAGQPRVFSIKK